MNINFLTVKGAKGFAIIDAEDYEKVSPFDWQVEMTGRVNHYHYHIGTRIGDRSSGQKCIRLSHLILGVQNTGDIRAQVKHLNKNPFDLRKANLALSTKRTYSKFHTNFDKQRTVCSWSLSVYVCKKQIRIGYYKSEEAVNDVIQFIKNSDFPLNTVEEVKTVRPIIRGWALAKEYTNLSAGGVVKPIYKIGDEKDNGRGFIQIKTENGWMLKHHFVLKQNGKRIPKNYTVAFKDGDKTNCDFENLELVSPEERAHRISLSKMPEEARQLADAAWQLKKEIKKQRNKKTQFLNVIGSDKPAIVDTADYEKVKDREWKLLNGQGRKVVGFRLKIGERRYKIATLASAVLDIDPKEKVRITHINRRALDYRRSNLKAVYYDRPGVIKPPSYTIRYVQNRKGAKSNWKIDIAVLSRHTTFGYYLTEASAKAVIAYAETLNLPLTNWDEFCAFKDEVRKWAIENGHTNKSGGLIGQGQRSGKPFRLDIYFLNKFSSKPWRVAMRFRKALGSRTLLFGQYETKEIAKTVADFAYNCGLPATNPDEAEKLRQFVKSWAIEKGYRGQSLKQKPESEPVQDFQFNSINSGEILQCQTIQ